MEMDRHEIVDMLGAYFDGGTLEAVAELLEDATADLEPGTVIKLGLAFAAMSKDLSAQAKDAIEDRIAGGRGKASRTISDGVLFEWVGEKSYSRIDTKLVKAEFPQENHPELYRLVNQRAFIRAKLT